MKRIFTILFLGLFLFLPGNAVLKEKNIDSTIVVLRAELENCIQEQANLLKFYNANVTRQHEYIVQTLQRCDQVSLMLYSQKQEYIFDLTYACHEATELYREFKMKRKPYDKIVSRLNAEINRYDSLITSLEKIWPPLKKQTQKNIFTEVAKDSLDSVRLAEKRELMKKEIEEMKKKKTYTLSPQSLQYRKACIELATTLRDNLIKLRDNIIDDTELYKTLDQKLKTINDYAIKRYGEIQKNIFVNGGDSYFTILSRWNMMFGQAKSEAKDKYQAESIQEKGKNIPVKSQWRGPIVTFLMIFILLYLTVAALISAALIKWLVPKRFRTEEFKKKRTCFILFGAVVIFAIAVSVVRTFMGSNYFMQMASGLLIEFAWLLGVILISLLVRLDGDQIKSGFRVYTPIMLVGFVIIAFRIIFIPNNIVNIAFPPIMLFFTVWQFFVTRNHKSKLPSNEIVYTWVSFVVIAVSTIATWSGFTLLAVQILIWWIFLLNCIQTITCFYYLLGIYEAHYLVKKIKGLLPTNKKQNGSTSKALSKEDVNKALTKLKNNKGAYINKTWFFDMVYKALVPIFGVAAFMGSIWWSADVFDLTDTVFNIYKYNFIELEGVIRLSLEKIAMAVVFYFIFNYFCYLFKAVYKYYVKKKHSAAGNNQNNKPNITLANNIINILVWGIYIVFCMIMLRIPGSAISVVAAGLATGMGFAMKDILENFFYGLSLMSGRVRVGDYIECEEIRGKVESITYQSTQITIEDGSVMAFLNSALFNKNFKNLTKGHSYEMVKVPVGVAYGSNVDEVRKMLIKAVDGLKAKNKDNRDIISTKRPINVVFSNFGDNSVDLFLTYWVLVEEKFFMTAKVKETIYNTLNDNSIEIPFPQRDIYIKQMPAAAPKQKKQ